MFERRVRIFVPLLEGRGITPEQGAKSTVQSDQA